jgi:signal transduction histidine kinase
MPATAVREGANGPSPSGGVGLRRYRRLVAAVLVYSLVVILVSVSTLAVQLDRPYGGFLWAWEHSRGTYRVDTFSAGGENTLQPADSITGVDGVRADAKALYELAQRRYRAAEGVCSPTRPSEPPQVTYTVQRRGQELVVRVPVRCFTIMALLQTASIPVVLAILIWAIGFVVYHADPGRELNLVLACSMAWTANVIVMESASYPDFYSPLGRFVTLFVGTPSPVLAAASFYHLVAILPRQHPSVRMIRTRWLWYRLIPLVLIVLGTARYVLASTWNPLVGRLDNLAWWGIAIFLGGVAVTISVRYTKIYFRTSSRQARSQVQLILLSMLMVFLALPFVVAQREPHRVTWLPVNQPVLIFWLVPVFIVMAFAVFRFQLFPGRVLGLKILVGLAVTVMMALAASPVLYLDPEVGFVALMAVLALTGLFWALPNPIMRALRRLVLPGTIERQVIEGFNADVQRIHDLETLPGAIVDSLETHLELRFAALWLEQEQGVLTLETYTGRAPADRLTYEIPTDDVWERAPFRVQDGPLAAAGCIIALPLEAGGRRVGLIGIGERWTEELFDETDLVALGVMADEAALTLGTARQIRALRMVPLQIEQAQLDERDRIAQDLHDSTQAQLSQLAFGLERVRAGLYTDPAQSEELLDDCIRDVNQAARDLRAVLRDLIPRRLLGQTLYSMLQEYVAVAQELDQGVEISLQGHSSVGEMLSLEKRLALLRICQQALDNAMAHAQPSQVRVTLQPSHDRDRVEFSILDDGRGFIQRPLAELVEQGHYGLYIMRSRALQYGGSLEVDSTPGGGTVVKGYLPVG